MSVRNAGNVRPVADTRGWTVAAPLAASRRSPSRWIDWLAVPETSLYRRHRPQTFDEVVGQEHVVRTLRNAVEQDRVHHAYLFVGSRGTGKTSMAKILARCLNCVRGPTTQPCGECESCRTIAAGTSLDVIEMDAASNRSVDDIRDLRERVGYVPAAGRWKVYIIDEAHMLTREAWNAFLKTLDQLVAYGGGPVETGDVLAVLGVADAELIFAAADAIAAGDGRAALKTVERLARSGRDATQFIRDLVAHLRQLLVIGTAETVPESFAVTAGPEERVRAQVEEN